MYPSDLFSSPPCSRGCFCLVNTLGFLTSPPHPNSRGPHGSQLFQSCASSVVNVDIQCLWSLEFHSDYKSFSTLQHKHGHKIDLFPSLLAFLKSWFRPSNFISSDSKCTSCFKLIPSEGKLKRRALEEVDPIFMLSYKYQDDSSSLFLPQWHPIQVQFCCVFLGFSSLRTGPWNLLLSLHTREGLCTCEEEWLTGCSPAHVRLTTYMFIIKLLICPMDLFLYFCKQNTPNRKLKQHPLIYYPQYQLLIPPMVSTIVVWRIISKIPYSHTWKGGGY